MARTVNEQIAEYIPEIIALFDLKVDGATVISGEYVTDYIKYRYNNYVTEFELYKLWINYSNIHDKDFAKAYKAWTATYDPLENYNGTETNIYLNQHGGTTDTTTHGKVTTNATGVGGVTTTNKVTTYDDTEFRNDSKTTQEGTTTSTDSGTTSVATTHTPATLTVDSVEYSADEITAEQKNRHGNLGVTSSQKMLTEEVQLRLRPLIEMYVDEFVSQYCYYVSEGGIDV